MNTLLLAEIQQEAAAVGGLQLLTGGGKTLPRSALQRGKELQPGVRRLVKLRP
jgi:hypothetical protein